MATTTATIFVGHAHQNSGGLNPTHLIQLTENSKPSLILRSLEANEKIIVMTPTVENTIDDIYLMIGIFILKKITIPRNVDTSENICLYDILTEAERKALYEETISYLNLITIKVVFNILDSSHLLHKIDEIKRYPNDYEVTLPSIKKEYNTWSNKIETKTF